MYTADMTHLFNVKPIVHLWVGSSVSLQHWFPKNHKALCKYGHQRFLASLHHLCFCLKE